MKQRETEERTAAGREEGQGQQAVEEKSRRFSLSRNQLKLLAVVCMFGDHVAHLFLYNLDPRSVFLRFFGRLTAPIMCFFLAEGFFYTRDRFAYAKRLCIAGLLSQPAFAYALGNAPWEDPYNMILTLFLSFLCMALLESSLPQGKKDAGVFILLGASCFCDWGLFGPLWVLGFYRFRGEKKKAFRSFAAVGFLMLCLDVGYSISEGRPWYWELWQAGVFLAIPLLLLYDPKKGERRLTYREKRALSPGKRAWLFLSKWFFYAFYPLHLLLLGYLKARGMG